jgi:hypothetical protein
LLVCKPKHASKQSERVRLNTFKHGNSAQTTHFFQALVLGPSPDGALYQVSNAAHRPHV